MKLNVHDETRKMKLLKSISHRLEGLRISDKKELKTAEDLTTTRPTVVRFTPKVTTYQPLPMEDLSQEEFASLWYSKTEMAAIKQDCAETVRQMVNGELRETDEYTARGLEYRTPQGQKERQYYKLVALDAVLDEQEVQEEQEVTDENAIAVLYQVHSIPRQEAAHQRGIRDEQEVYSKDRVGSTPTKMEFTKPPSIRQPPLRHVETMNPAA